MDHNRRGFLETDILVAGSGIAGLSFAIRAAAWSKVLLVTKKELVEANTNYAQGGIAAALGLDDNSSEHLQDTLLCGDGLCDKKVCGKILSDAPRLVRELQEWGVRFTRGQGGALDLGLEGGHHRRRIVHAEDFTGREIERALIQAARKSRGIAIRENVLVLDLLTAHNKRQCGGALLLDLANNRTIETRARCVVLATGGAGKVYIYTTNPEIATGDGLAIAYRAGAELENLEFVQFHPTCLHHPKLRHFLISEAVRGEGAVLRNLKGQAFMKRYHPRGELAGRDIVARAIDDEMKKSGADFVHLDITRKPRPFLRRRFPNIYRTLASAGIDMARDMIPVVPAAHYFCGGIRTKVSGRTTLDGLWAIGEAASTGFHGANRLASNSLLEACAMAHYAAEEIRTEFAGKDKAQRYTMPLHAPTHWGKRNLAGSDLNALIVHNWDEVRRLMMNYVGIVRSTERLRRARRRIGVIEAEVAELVQKFSPTRDLAELANIATLSRLIIAAGLKRRESRGLHFMADFPKKNPRLAHPLRWRRP